MAPGEDYYTILGVSPGADGAAIRAAYRALMRRYHPDVNASADAIATATAINEAYGCLRDASRRAVYDWERNGRARRLRAAQAAAQSSAHPVPPRPVWTGPSIPAEPSMPWYQPTWGKAAGLGMAAVITSVTFTITSAVPPAGPAVAKEAVDIRMRAAQKEPASSDCSNKRASAARTGTTNCRS